MPRPWVTVTGRPGCREGEMTRTQGWASRWTFATVGAAIVLAFALWASGASAGTPRGGGKGTAIVIVTGLGTTTPFVTPDRPCRSRQPAGDYGSFFYSFF